MLLRSQQRMLLVDSRDLIFASIEGGLISIAAKDAEGTSNYRTLEELTAPSIPIFLAPTSLLSRQHPSH